MVKADVKYPIVLPDSKTLEPLSLNSKRTDELDTSNVKSVIAEKKGTYTLITFEYTEDVQIGPYIQKQNRKYYFNSMRLYFTPMHNFEKIKNSEDHTELKLEFRSNENFPTAKIIYICILVEENDNPKTLRHDFFNKLIKGSASRTTLGSNGSNSIITDIIPSDDRYYYYEPNKSIVNYGDDVRKDEVVVPDCVYVYETPIYITSVNMNKIKILAEKSEPFTANTQDSGVYFNNPENNTDTSDEFVATVDDDDNIQYLDCGFTDGEMIENSDNTISSQDNTYYTLLLLVFLIVFPLLFLILLSIVSQLSDDKKNKLLKWKMIILLSSMAVFCLIVIFVLFKGNFKTKASKINLALGIISLVGAIVEGFSLMSSNE